MDELKSTIAKNLCELRTKAHLTQLQLAEMLNYSDKAVSKWERGEAIPDVRVLIQLAEIYGITLDEIVKGDGAFPRMEIDGGRRNKKRLYITLLSFGLVWFIATAVFTVFYLIGDIGGVHGYQYLVFVAAALPAAIVLQVFSAMWGNRFTNTLATSGIIWSCALIIDIFTIAFTDFERIHFVYVVAAVFEILTVLWYVFRRYVAKNKN